jgi:hypothetical protein
MKIKEGGNGTNRSTVDGRTTKEPIHSPLEILPERYTAISREGQHSIQLFTNILFVGAGFAYKACFSQNFLIGDNPRFLCSNPVQPLNYAPRVGCTCPERFPSRTHARHPSPTPQAMSRGADMVSIQEKM